MVRRSGGGSLDGGGGRWQHCRCQALRAGCTTGATEHSPQRYALLLGAQRNQGSAAEGGQCQSRCGLPSLPRLVRRYEPASHPQCLHAELQTPRIPGLFVAKALLSGGVVEAQGHSWPDTAWVGCELRAGGAGNMPEVCHRADTCGQAAVPPATAAVAEGPGPAHTDERTGFGSPSLWRQLNSVGEGADDAKGTAVLPGCPALGPAGRWCRPSSPQKHRTADTFNARC